MVHISFLPEKNEYYQMPEAGVQYVWQEELSHTHKSPMDWYQRKFIE